MPEEKVSQQECKCPTGAKYHVYGCALDGELLAAADAGPRQSDTCGEPAASFIPRWGMYFTCVLPKGHEGEHKQGGTCFKHGEYVGEKCPKWPDCSAPVPQEAAPRCPKCGSNDPMNGHPFCRHEFHPPNKATAPDSAMRVARKPAKAVFQVRLKCGIGNWQGEWTGREEQYEDKSVVLLETDDRATAEAFFQKFAVPHEANVSEVQAVRKIRDLYQQGHSDACPGCAERDTQVAALIREAGSERERELTTVIVNLIAAAHPAIQSGRNGWVQSTPNVKKLEIACAEAARIVAGGESK